MMVQKPWLSLLWLTYGQICMCAPVLHSQQNILTAGQEPLSRHDVGLCKTQLHYNITFGNVTFEKRPKEDIKTYFPLNFTNFEVWNTTAAIEQDLLHGEDADCAVKGSNAIFTSGGVSRFDFDRDAIKTVNVSEYFDMYGVTLKPLGPAPRGIRASINAWRVHNKTVLDNYSGGASWGGDGFLKPIKADFGAYFPGWGKDVNMIEIYGLTQEGKPWPLCVGRIEVFLKERTEGDM